MDSRELKAILAAHAAWLHDQRKGSRAVLSDAVLRDADLRGAALRDAVLRRADLRDADLRATALRGADLRGADLFGADLRGAVLCDANLRDTDLRDAVLRRADLRGADLCGAALPGYQIPQDGSITGWKKLADNCVAVLLIPPAAKRTASLIGRKCRAEYAYVQRIEDRLGVEVSRGQATHNDHQYIVGEYVYPDSYDDDPRVECAHGIHFFLTREEAENW